MVPDSNAGNYPRPLSAQERGWVDWILPEERPGYREYRSLLETMQVIGEGRRGQGENILGTPGDLPDLTAPLAPVFAYGAIETDAGTLSVTLRELFDRQISLEIVAHSSENLPEQFTELRRWTYSRWKSGEPCPQCTGAVREIPMHAPDNRKFILVICPRNQRIWLYDEATQVNKLIPVTNYYNELMLHKNIRDPKIALQSKRLFTELEQYSDADMAYAFLTYSKLKQHVHLEGTIEADKKEAPSLLTRIFRRNK